MKSSIPSSYSKLIKLLLLSTLFHGALSATVDLFERSNYDGTHREVEVTRCTNVRGRSLSLKLKGTCVVLYKSPCCQGESVQIVADTENLASATGFTKVKAISPCGDYSPPFPPSLEEKWVEHGQNVSKVFEDVDVALYYNQDMLKDSLQFHQDYLKKVWTYVKQVYGNFGPEGGRLFSILHANTPKNPYARTEQSYFEEKSDCRNLVDLVGTNPDAWTGKDQTEFLDSVTHYISNIVEFASNGVDISPTYHLWGSKFSEIFIYDVYNNLNLTKERDRYFNKVQNSTHNNPARDTYWFRDWFFPIYNQYGGAKVLKNYFELLAKHFPRQANGWQYSRMVNMGEFIHFFSGAAGVDLNPQAYVAFESLDSSVDEQLQNAKRDFPGIKY